MLRLSVPHETIEASNAVTWSPRCGDGSTWNKYKLLIAGCDAVEQHPRCSTWNEESIPQSVKMIDVMENHVPTWVLFGATTQQ
jgi:hypothetical protein